MEWGAVRLSAKGSTVGSVMRARVEEVRVVVVVAVVVIVAGEARAEVARTMQVEVRGKRST